MSFSSAKSRAAAAPSSFTYVLQLDELAPSKSTAMQLLANSGRDWIIVDPDYSKGWELADLDEIRAAHPGRKIIAYLSIGEAEKYRSYWDPAWDANGDGTPDGRTPPWLVSQNPSWSGNYKVRYWHADWQATVYREVERIVRMGFDGAINRDTSS